MGAETVRTEVGRRTSRRSRSLAVVVATVMIGAIGLTIVDMVGQSDREEARVVNGVAYGSTAARDFGYVPRLIVADSRVVRLTIHNQGAHTHTFTIDSLGVDRAIHPGETDTVTLRLPRDGRFAFYCRFHQSFGMRGHILVRQG